MEKAKAAGKSPLFQKYLAGPKARNMHQAELEKWNYVKMRKDALDSMNVEEPESYVPSDVDFEDPGKLHPSEVRIDDRTISPESLCRAVFAGRRVFYGDDLVTSDYDGDIRRYKKAIKTSILSAVEKMNAEILKPAGQDVLLPTENNPKGPIAKAREYMLNAGELEWANVKHLDGIPTDKDFSINPVEGTLVVPSRKKSGMLIACVCRGCKKNGIIQLVGILTYGIIVEEVMTKPLICPTKWYIHGCRFSSSKLPALDVSQWAMDTVPLDWLIGDSLVPTLQLTKASTIDLS